MEEDPTEDNALEAIEVNIVHNLNFGPISYNFQYFPIPRKKLQMTTLISKRNWAIPPLYHEKVPAGKHPTRLVL